MTRLLRWSAVPIAAALLALLGVTPVLADGGCQPFGNTTRVKHGSEKGAILLTSDVSQKVAYGGIDIEVTDHPRFADLRQLTTDYAMTEGVCFGGSPRFQINVLPPGDSNPNDTKNIFVYFGSLPLSGANACPEAIGNEVSTG